MPGRTRNFGFFPAPSADYSVGQEPEIARRLNRLGRALHLHLIGISGYRTPAHSAAVGGFPDDPHTQGRASDTPGIESVPESVLERFGLTRPFPGAAEADHIQLYGVRGGSSNPVPRRGGAHPMTIGQWWIHEGGPSKVAPIMAAIALAESGGQLGATHENSDGTTDYGPFQVNSSHGFDPVKLTTDWAYTTRAAISVYKSQGLHAWTTYNTGAYKSHMGQSSGAMPTFGRTRPGGAPPEDTGVQDAFTAYEQDASWHWDPLSPLPIPTPFNVPHLGPDLTFNSPLDPFKDAVKAVKGTADFVKWIAWIFHPKNVLRAVEFLTGITLMGAGLHTLMAVYKDAPQSGAASRAGQAARRGAREAFSMTPPGRALRTRRAVQFGKRKARSHKRETEAQAASKKGERTERKRQARKSDKREKRRARFSRERVPF